MYLRCWISIFCFVNSIATSNLCVFILWISLAMSNRCHNNVFATSNLCFFCYVNIRTMSIRCHHEVVATLLFDADSISPRFGTNKYRINAFMSNLKMSNRFFITMSRHYWIDIDVILIWYRPLTLNFCKGHYLI